MSDRVRGKVKWWSKEKGFGFIETASGDVFAHSSALPLGTDELCEGQQVNFMVEQGSRGLRAKAIGVFDV